MSDYLLSTLGVYGLPVLFVILLVGCIGVPMPASLLLLAAGSFVEQGELSLWPTLLLSAGGAIIGDNIGYALGRWGGRRVSKRLGNLIGGEERLKSAERWLNHWGGAGIFLSRWLFTPLGPVINLTSGLTGYSWPRFLCYDIAGEVLWVVLYVSLGRAFSSSVQAMSEVVGDFTWAIIGLLFVAILGWKFVQYFRSPDAEEEKPKTSGSLVDETP
ncbi:MAG TPA: DedA family protein [Pyrinomonadaceae bacterium]|jgi:membrane protein DedA with SNARE-associated domain